MTVASNVRVQQLGHGRPNNPIELLYRTRNRLVTDIHTRNPILLCKTARNAPRDSSSTAPDQSKKLIN